MKNKMVNLCWDFTLCTIQRSALRVINILKKKSHCLWSSAIWEPKTLENQVHLGYTVVESNDLQMSGFLLEITSTQGQSYIVLRVVN